MQNSDPQPKNWRTWWSGFATAVLLAAGGLLAVVVYQGDQPMQAHRVMPARAAFSIDIPTGCEVKEDAPRSESQVFRVVCGGVEYAGVYTSNAADRSIPRSRVIATEYAWPSQVQTWSRVVPGNQEKADRISASVSVRTMN